MMWDEFVKKTGISVDHDTYENRVERVYRVLPCKVYGGASNTDFCQWVKTHGGMDVIDALLPLCESYEDGQAEVDEVRRSARAVAEDLSEKVQNLSATIVKLKSQLAVYESIVPTEELSRRVAQLPRDRLLEILAGEGAQ